MSGQVVRLGSNMAFMNLDAAKEAAALRAALEDGPCKIEPRGWEILTVIWIRPEKTAGGVIITQPTREEDVWQGKVSLVVDIGKGAYERGGTSIRCKVGDWVVTNPLAGQKLQVNRAYARIINDDQVLAVVNGPDGVL